MSLRSFIRRNRLMLDEAIRQAVGRRDLRLTDTERRLWVLHDEGLREWANREGVRL